MALPEKFRNVAIEANLSAERPVFTVKSSCMGKSIPEGSRVVVRRVAPDSLCPGDVALFREGGALFLHRFLGRIIIDGREYFLAKGDIRRRPDLPWPQSAFIGKAVEIIDGDAGVLSTSGAIDNLKYTAYLAASRVALRMGWLQKRKCENVTLGIECHNLFWQVEVAGELFADSAVLQNFMGTANDSGLLERSIKVLPASLANADSICDESEWPFQLHAAGIHAAVNKVGKEARLYLEEGAALEAGLKSVFRLIAFRLASEQGGICLHAASSVSDSSGRFYIFAGPSGTGKSTSASAVGRILDEDMVLLLPDGNGWKRTRWDPVVDCAQDSTDAGEYKAQSIIFPQAGTDFNLEKCSGVEALRLCAHLPPAQLRNACSDGFLSAATRLAESLAVFRLKWQKGADLRAFLDGKFPAA